jgi:adenylosuccinate lyase
MDVKYRTPVSDLISRQNRAKAYLTILETVVQVQSLTGLIFDSYEADMCLSDIRDDPQQLVRVLSAWDSEEERLRHETAAFIFAVRRYLPRNCRPYVYFGMTSSDLMDTADAMIYNQIINEHFTPLLFQLFKHPVPDTPKLRRGRTHGRLAETVDTYRPYLKAQHDLRRAWVLLDGKRLLAKISGPVGAYNAALTLNVEHRVCEKCTAPAEPRRIT